MAETLILEKFTADPELLRLEDILTEFDLFTFLDLSTSEEVHSRILAWLLDPKGNHSLGDFFLTNFLLETKAATDKQIHSADWSESTVQREWYNDVDGKTGYLDILILNARAAFACAIENKILAGEHGEQLTRYRQALERRYGAYHRSHLFLSPQGTSPVRTEERSVWTPVDYETILRLVEKTNRIGADRQDQGVAAFLQQYVTTLRRRIVPDTSLKRLATRLYLRHREAIDLINRYRGRYYHDEVRDICIEAITCRDGWHLVGERDRGELLGIIDASWLEYDVLHTGTAWLPQTDSLLILDFDFREVGQVKLILTISTSDREDIRKLLFHKTKERHPHIFDHRGDRRGEYSNRTVRLYASEPILCEADFVDGDVQSWREKMLEWVSNFAQNDFLEMNGIILDSLREIEDELAGQED